MTTDKDIAEIMARVPKMAALAEKFPLQASMLARAVGIIDAAAEWGKYRQSPSYLKADQKLTALNKIVDDLGKEVCRIEDAILSTPATTAAGLAVKAKLAPASVPDDDEDDTWQGIVYRSIHADILAMEG